MSYDLVRGIGIKGDKVFIKASSNNVYPHTYYTEELPRLTKMLQEQGQEAVDIEILKQYENGNFQPGTKNKYSRALDVLRHMPEYAEFDWRGSRDIPDEKRKSAEFNALLLKALHTQLPKEKYIITKTLYDGVEAYFWMRKNAGSCKWYYDPKKAKIFNYKQDAENVKKWFTMSENWKVQKI